MAPDWNASTILVLAFSFNRGELLLELTRIELFTPVSNPKYVRAIRLMLDFPFAATRTVKRTLRAKIAVQLNSISDSEDAKKECFSNR